MNFSIEKAGVLVAKQNVTDTMLLFVPGSSGECEALKADFKKISRECVSAKDQANATLQCECWGRAYADVVKIKKAP